MSEPTPTTTFSPSHSPALAPTPALESQLSPTSSAPTLLGLSIPTLPGPEGAAAEPAVPAVTAASTATPPAADLVVSQAEREDEVKDDTPTKATAGSLQSLGPAPSLLGTSAAEDSNGEFSCNICFDTSISPVLTLCGHLFCWSCLHQWLEAQHRNPTCPVCKAGCGQDKVIPIYGRGKEQLDPRTTTPKRPAGQRPEPVRNGGMMNNAGFSLTTGQMAFAGNMLPPFMFSPLGIHFGAVHSSTSVSMSVGMQPPPQAYASRLFFMFITLVLVGILLY